MVDGSYLNRQILLRRAIDSFEGIMGVTREGSGFEGTRDGFTARIDRVTLLGGGREGLRGARQELMADMACLALCILIIKQMFYGTINNSSTL